MINLNNNESKFNELIRIEGPKNKKDPQVAAFCCRPAGIYLKRFL